MKSRIIQIKKAITSLLFLLIMGGIVFNSTFFLHTHRTACGKTVVHAHPFNKNAEKKDPVSQHTHKKIDLQVISSIDYYVLTHLSIDINYKPVFESEYLSKPSFYLDSRNAVSITSRGPPAC